MMSEDDNKALIQQLIPYYSDENFNERLEYLTQKLSKSRRFLIKMEINRLYHDCNQNIDLRGRVSDQCREHKHDGLIHYLDDTALKLFEETLSDYGTYTVGVFEKVTNTKNSYREKQLKDDKARRSELQSRNTTNIIENIPTTKVDNEEHIPPNYSPKVSLGNLNYRIEERFNILAPVTVRLPNGQSANVITTNLSVQGARVKLAQNLKVTIGDMIYLDFLEVENNLAADIAYQIVDVLTNNEKMWLCLKRIHKQPNIDKALEAYIKTNRRGIATDVEHIIDGIRSLGYQYVHLNKMVGLPLFFEQQQEKYKPLFALSNFENKPVLDYWRTHNNTLRINSLCSHDRISNILSFNQPEKPTLLFCFTHIAKGRKHFYSATEHELEQSGLTDLFMQFGAGKESFKIYQLYLHNVQDYQWKMPDILPLHLIAKENLTLAQNKHLLKLHDIKLMAYLLDITNSENFTFYRDRDIGEQQVTLLQQFGHKDDQDHGLNLIETNTMTMSNRREDRFTYQTRVLINLKRDQYAATTIDFSVHGMQVNVEQELPVSKGDILEVVVPLFNKAAKHEEDSILFYEVMHISNEGQIINLKISVTPETEHGPKTIYRIIKSNQHNLTAQVAPPASFTKSLCLLYSNYISSLVINISKIHNNYKISQVIEPKVHNPLFNLFSALSSTPSHCDMSAISQNNTLKEIFSGPLMLINPTSPAIFREVYIQLINDRVTGRYNTLTHYVEDFKTPKQHNDFMKKALKEGQLFAIRIIISRVPPINYKTFSREIIYAAKQVSYKTRQLQADLDTIVATAEIVDIMDELKQRFNLHS